MVIKIIIIESTLLFSMKKQNYIKNIFLIWFLFVLIFSNFEFFHFHNFVRVASNIDIEFITLTYKFNYFNKITKCLLDDFLLTLKNLVFKEKYYPKNLYIFQLFIPPQELVPIDFSCFPSYVRGPPALT